VANVNPLGKIPVLLLDDSTSLFDSRVIVEYLDNVAPNNKLMPNQNRERIEVKRWEALADGVCDAAALTFLEKKRPPAQQAADWIKRQEDKIGRSLEFMSEELGDKSFCMGMHFSLADVAVGCALGYLILRFPEIHWQEQHANLARLYDKLMTTLRLRRDRAARLIRIARARPRGIRASALAIAVPVSGCRPLPGGEAMASASIPWPPPRPHPPCRLPATRPLPRVVQNDDADPAIDRAERIVLVEQYGGRQADDAQHLVLIHAAGNQLAPRSVGTIGRQLPVRETLGAATELGGVGMPRQTQLVRYGIQRLANFMQNGARIGFRSALLVSNIGRFCSSTI
jgi:glutathione S-transferase